MAHHVFMDLLCTGAQSYLKIVLLQRHHSSRKSLHLGVMVRFQQSFGHTVKVKSNILGIVVSISNFENLIKTNVMTNINMFNHLC